MVIPSHRALGESTGYLASLALTASKYSGADPEQALQAYARLASAHGASHLCTFALHVTRGDGALLIADPSRGEMSSLWFA